MSDLTNGRPNLRKGTIMSVEKRAYAASGWAMLVAVIVGYLGSLAMMFF